MQNVITTIEIRKFQGLKEAVFPAGTIVTPSARDWAKEHHIELVWEGEEKKGSGESDREAWLRVVVARVAAEFVRQGRPLMKETLSEAVWRCLERLGAAQNVPVEPPA